MSEQIFNWADDKTEPLPERQQPTSDLAAARARVAKLEAAAREAENAIADIFRVPGYLRIEPIERVDALNNALAALRKVGGEE